MANLRYGEYTEMPDETMLNNQTVLFVEHETDIARTFARACDDLTVHIESSASECLVHLEQRAVDCIVSNYDLPESDGLSLLESVRDDYPNLPFVLLTGSGGEHVASEAISAGVSDYLPETTVDGMDDLRTSVENAINNHLGGRGESRIEALTTAFPDVAFLLDDRGYYCELLVGPNTENLAASSPANLVGRRLHDVFPEDEADRFLAHIHRTIDTGRVETMEYPLEVERGERWFEARTTPLGTKIDGREAVVWVARDITDRRGREHKLTRQHEELETLNQIHRVIQEVIHELVHAATRDDIEQLVCERLVDSGLYELAWTDESEVSREGVTPRTRAGGIDGYLDTLIDFGTAIGDDPADMAMRTDELQVIRDVRDTDKLPPAVCQEALDCGVESGISIPISYGNTVYGTLSLVSTQSGVLGKRAQAALETLGDTIGFAINAAKNKKILLSDSAVELELQVNDPREVFLIVSRELDCRCYLHGLVPASDGRLLHYVRIDGASPKRVKEMVSDAEQIEEYRLIENDDAGFVLETIMSESTVKKLIEAGAAVQSATADSGEVTLVAEVPHDTDVRQVVDTFQSAYPNSRLVGKRTVGRGTQTAREFRQSLTERLTDRQETALRTAYFAGYYDWPRGSTAEEVAGSLDITSPTLHYHLRKAQNELLSAFIDG
ncbi:PAS domain S-box-containing protein [Haladaptatus litoreus]|uniref:PAS domain S-box-containing protein n=1 Tax=Haladaptatus litoreus TaxID=553468 RepID=A0A1N6WNF4_9EURY|nr:bacterio-opsin activator domain-containing protein [Haladaptatus litoreus]SIQ91649.1 PAS domain S-box-containing protein [Haladaptatus litoreus]